MSTKLTEYAEWVWDFKHKWFKCSKCFQFADILWIDYHDQRKVTPHRSEYCSCCGTKMKVNLYFEKESIENE